ncbi:MAG TPA: hypothetical protein VHF22_09645, partial [Planctomycetota bacterium]|nr:hypothetical protein [Planctomycetota bacterium]
MRTPAIVKSGSTYMLYYTCSKGNGSSTSLATSTDGIHWTKHPANPVLKGVSGQFDAYQADAGSVIVDGGAFKLWYTARAASGSATAVALATSPDGVVWTRAGAVLFQGASGEWDESQINSPCVAKVGATYRMWYTGIQGPRVAIGHATSADGVNWTKDGANPVFEASTSGWDDAQVALPAVVALPSGASSSSTPGTTDTSARSARQTRRTASPGRAARRAPSSRPPPSPGRTRSAGMRCSSR